MKRAAAAFGLFVFATVACGKKGPPLPPLVRLPAAPVEFKAARQGDAVAVQFAIPSANTDGSTPADVVRVDVYALTGPSTVTPSDILKRGTRLNSVAVNPPADPDVPPDTPPRVEKPRPPDGVDQGTVIHLVDSLRPEADGDKDAVRAYLAVGLSKRGRQGAFSQRALVPMSPAPSAPPQPTVTYDDKAIALKWATSGEETAAGALPPPTYEVYLAGEGGRRLTTAPLAVGSFEDRPIEWGVARCFVVRAIGTAQGLPIESAASAQACVTPVDTFPPAVPLGLNVVAAAGAMNLIWDPGSDADLAGYLVLRAIAPATTLEPVTPALLGVATFRDTVPPGARVTYGVKAVDKSGNTSAMSTVVEEIAR